LQKILYYFGEGETELADDSAGTAEGGSERGMIVLTDVFQDIFGER
jgi:hypothetical protein